VSNSESGDLELISEKVGKKHKITANIGGNVIHVDTIDPAVAIQRSKYAKALHSNCPAISHEMIEAELLKIAATDMKSGVTPSTEKASQVELSEVDIRRVVRPELFHTAELSGITIPVVNAIDGKLIPRWRTYVRWADGRREVIDRPEMITLPSGGTIYFHPDPGDPATNDPPAWSLDSRRAWLTNHLPSPADVFRRLCEQVAYFLDFPPETAPGTTATIVLWVMLTYVYSAWDAVPYLCIGGPMGSGKSRLLEILFRLAFRPLVSANLTAPTLFRTLHARGGTMLYDEAERLRQATPEAQEVNSIFLSGYKRGIPATRLEPVGDSFRLVQFDVFGPKAIACIAGLLPTLASRCIPITMFRAGVDSEKPKRRLDANPENWARLRDDLHVLALEYGPTWIELANRPDVVPSAINGRNFEIWQPLLALAQWFESRGAGRLLELVKHHALASVESAKDDAIPEADEILLEVLAEAIRAGKAPTPGELLQNAQERDQVTFKGWYPTSVSRRLKIYGIKPPKKSNGQKKYRHVTPDALMKIERHYGIDLGFSESEETPRSVNVPERTSARIV
jgi:hypothetical protein